MRQALAAALERLVGLLSDRADDETAIPHARRWLALDPLHEPAHRQLMGPAGAFAQKPTVLKAFWVESPEVSLGNTLHER